MHAMHAFTSGFHIMHAYCASVLCRHTMHTRHAFHAYHARIHACIHIMAAHYACLPWVLCIRAHWLSYYAAHAWVSCMPAMRAHYARTQSWGAAPAGPLASGWGTPPPLDHPARQGVLRLPGPPGRRLRQHMMHAESQMKYNEILLFSLLLLLYYYYNYHYYYANSYYYNYYGYYNYYYSYYSIAISIVNSLLFHCYFIVNSLLFHCYFTAFHCYFIAVSLHSIAISLISFHCYHAWWKPNWWWLLLGILLVLPIQAFGRSWCRQPFRCTWPIMGLLIANLYSHLITGCVWRSLRFLAFLYRARQFRLSRGCWSPPATITICPLTLYSHYWAFALEFGCGSTLVIVVCVCACA